MEKKIKNKSKLIYKLVTGITLFVPLPLYLLLMATLFNIKSDYIIYTTFENVEVITYIDNGQEIETYFITTKNNATMDGIVEFRDGRYGIVIKEDDIIKIDKNYYSYIIRNEKRELVDIKKYELQKQQGYKIPLSFFISLLGVLIAVLIIQGKMQWQKKHPRLAAFIALLSVTVILFILDAIISNILGVFIVATASWGIYCLEYLMQQNKIDEKTKENKESELVRLLREAMQ